MTGRLVLLVLLCLGACPGGATILVPMSDDDLVATSDVIAVGTVTDIRSVLLGGNRIVTRITIGVEQALKGRPGPTLVVTEAGGSVGGRRVVVFGAPEYATGERVLVFLRLARDGSLATTGMALGKYAIEDAPGSPLRARRMVPVRDVRALDAFLGGIATRAAGPGGAATDGRAGAAVAVAEREAVTSAFTLTPGGDGLPARWFEADCGVPIAFSPANSDDARPTESRSALTAALAAWSGAGGVSLALTAGPETTPTPSLISGTFDGRSVIQFNDPFEEVPDLVSCTGVLARGGFVDASDESFGLRQTVNGTTFGRIFEGDVVLNQGTGACVSGEAGLAEVLAHELGHALGFGHSSNDPAEPDPVLRDALMYFLAHDDGRGAALGEDDIAGLAFGYPAARAATTPLAVLACKMGIGVFANSCFGRQLSVAPFNAFDRARAAAGRAAAATTAGKQKKALRKARRFLAKTVASSRKIDGDCGAAIRGTAERLRDEATALLPTL